MSDNYWKGVAVGVFTYVAIESIAIVTVLIYSIGKLPLPFH